MEFLKLSKKDIQTSLNNCTYQELIEFTRYIDDVTNGKLDLKKIHSTRKTQLVDYLSIVLSNTLFVENIYKKLVVNESSKVIYESLVWEVDELQSDKIVDLVFIQRNESYYANESDTLVIRGNFKSLLMMLFPIPAGFELLAVDIEDELDSYLTYSNEDGIFNFISVISDMLKNNLVEFGKSNEKPLAKSLNVLKSTTGIKEFYDDKKLSTFATDMLTRSFSYYYWSSKGFKGREVDILRNFMITQFDDKLEFFITRIFLGHLKKVRYDYWYTKQSQLFDVLKLIISKIPQDGWVDMQNILKFCRYQNIRIDLDSSYKTRGYYMEGEVVGDNGVFVDDFYADRNHYNILFFEPILKASFFYLGALGVFELKYNEPYSRYTLSAKGKAYISPWDSLEFVKLSELGKYIFGFSDSYEQREIVKKETTIKLDEYKPIITVEKTDTIMQAKLDGYCEKLDDGKYILSFAKIFKDCKNTKVLDAKIDGFYKNIEKNPPQVFKEFFAEIKLNSNMLKRDLNQVVIELNNNKKLLNLFMKNKKLQEIVIKAQGYRVLVLKQDIPKLTKIVKDNGFFIEF